MRRGSEDAHHRGGLARSLLALALACALALPAVASADVGRKIILRCTHGQSLSGFTPKQYRRALQEMPTSVSEYSDCEELIQQAEIAAAGGKGGGGTGAATGGEGEGAEAISNTAIETTPEEKQAIASAASDEPAPVHLGAGSGGEIVAPGVVHASLASATSSLPTPLLAVLALLLACAAALGGRAAWGRMAHDDGNGNGLGGYDEG